MILAATVTLASAAMGFAIARSGSEVSDRAKLGGHASAGALQISFPSRWTRTAVPSGLPLRLTDEIAVAPLAPRGAVLVVGRGVASTPQLLPPSLLKTLPSAPRGSAIRLGEATFYRYLDLDPRGRIGPEAVYAMSTTAGAVLGVCVLRRAPAAFLSDCERSLATLRFSAGTTLPPGPIPAYASALNRTISRLNAVRASVGGRLLHASGATAQSVAAYKLAAAHTAAAKALAHLSTGPANAANAALVAALQLNSAAYRALAQAASRQDPAAYDRGRALVQSATRAWKGAYSRLGAFGYSVS